MGLSQLQRSLIEKTRSVGAAREAEPLSDADCLFLIATIARDLSLLEQFPEMRQGLPDFFRVGIHDARNLETYRSSNCLKHSFH